MGQRLVPHLGYRQKQAKLFNYLKTQFDFVLIITHLDSIKDYMDKLIPIRVKNGFSQLTF